MANEIWQFSRIIIDDLLRANASIATQLQKACDEPCQLGNPPPVRHAASACASSAPRALANSLTAAALSSPVEHYLKPPELHRGAGYSMSLDGDERFLDLADACKAIPMTAADLIALHRRLALRPGVVELHADRAVIENYGGKPTTFTRHAAPPARLAVWDVGR